MAAVGIAYFCVTVVFFVLCLWAPRFDIDNKDPKQVLHPDRTKDDDERWLVHRSPKKIRFICIVLIVIGAYTFINGLLYVENVPDMYDHFWGEDQKVDKIMKETGAGKTGMYAGFIGIWPILAIIFGGWTFLKGIFRYKKLVERGY